MNVIPVFNENDAILSAMPLLVTFVPSPHSIPVLTDCQVSRPPFRLPLTFFSPTCCPGCLAPTQKAGPRHLSVRSFGRSHMHHSLAIRL